MTLLGRNIGRYKILEQLGQGGMSVVYKGLDTALDREVAVKVLHPHLASKDESRKRLSREARAVARLHHPNILEVFDFSSGEGADAYIVTEYIRGRTMRQFIAEHSLEPPELAAAVVHDIAAALAHAHDSGVIHRDLKPENVMVRDDGVLKLMDFGIAKIIDRDEKMTMTGALVGSPAHMAPEIIEGDEAGPEADVFSLGTMLYLFATGKLPFTAANTTATLRKILECSFDDPRQLAPSMSDELAEIITRCLARNPRDRFPSASSLRDALAQHLTSIGIKDPSDVLKTFFLDPDGARGPIRARVVTGWLELANTHLAQGRPARALAALNVVLAHDPGNEQAKTALLQLQRRNAHARRTQLLKRVGALALGGASVIAAIAGVVHFATRPLATLRTAPASAEVAVLPRQVTPEPPPVAPPVAPAVAAPTTSAPATTPRPAVTPAKPKAGPILREVMFQIRPWGYIAVDGGPRSSDALSTHRLKLAEGTHQVTVTCDLCEAKGRTSEFKVSADSQEVHLVAPLQPSVVRFTGFPDGAVMSIGHQELKAAAAQRDGFVVATPPGGSLRMEHEFKYQVTLGDDVLQTGKRQVPPGQPIMIVKGEP